MRCPIAFVLLLAAAGLAHSQEPPRPSVDALVEQVTGIRAKRAELDKQEQVALAALKAELKRQSDLIDKLGGVGPAPKPPDPKPPEPTDPLRAKLKAAFDGDGAATEAKREQAKDLAALYRQAATLAADVTVATSGDLLKRVRDAGGALIGPDALKDVRRAAGAELAAVLPTDAPLSDAQRDQAAKLFVRLAVTLEEIAK